MTAKQLAEKIRNWEVEAGESFTDYFMHDNVKDQSWAYFLLGKGHVERAVEIVDEIHNGNKCIDQELLYEIYSNDGEWSEEQYNKNVILWAEFLISMPHYCQKVTEFFEEH